MSKIIVLEKAWESGVWLLLGPGANCSMFFGLVLLDFFLVLVVRQPPFEF